MCRSTPLTESHGTECRGGREAHGVPSAVSERATLGLHMCDDKCRAKGASSSSKLRLRKEARDEQPMRPAQTKDRTRNEIAPLEGGDGDVSMSSGAQDVMDQDRTGDDGEDIQAQDALGQGARNSGDVVEGHLGPHRAEQTKTHET